MKQLVYLIAFGAECLEQFKLCYEGMKNCKVDIALITDQPFTDKQVRIVNVADPGTFKQQSMFRIYAPKYITFNTFDRVWYMDCDFLVFADIFDKYKESTSILLSNEKRWTMGHECFSGDLRGDEWQMYKSLPAINAGILSVPRRYFDGFFTMYRKAVETLIINRPELNIPEQMALNGIYARHRKDIQMNLLTESDIGFPEKGVKGDEMLYHYACYKFADKLKLMREAWDARH